jgi:uncharacterized protein (TIGR03086 family)
MSPESDRHARVAAAFTGLVEATTDWSAPTPVPEWQAHDVVEHLLTWLAGAVHAWTGVDLTDDEAASLPHRWRRRCGAVQAILDDPASAARPMSSGPFAGEAIASVLDRIYTPDVYMHSWDLARATRQQVVLDPDAARDLLAGMRGMEEVIRESGEFGTARPTSSTDPVDQLMAFIGRDPHWRP